MMMMESMRDDHNAKGEQLKDHLNARIDARINEKSYLLRVQLYESPFFHK